jgi:hypothetical protein
LAKGMRIPFGEAASAECGTLSGSIMDQLLSASRRCTCDRDVWPCA